MIPFFGITEVQLAEWRAAMGVPAENMPKIPNPVINCQICETPIDFATEYVETEDAPSSLNKRHFHVECLIVHLIRNENNPSDEISSYITRTPICNTATQNSNSPITSSPSTEDDSHYGAL